MGGISLLACGGTGANIASHFAEYHDQHYDGFADIKTYFVDTSRSNLSPSIPDERVFIYRDSDGSQLDGNGKLRKNNIGVLSESSTIKQILHTFKPEDLTIIVSSGGGGTGSVAGPLIAKELISRGELVLVILVGSTMSKTDVKNTLDTLKTYENLAVKLGTPINVLYRENSPTMPRSKVDAEIQQYIYLLGTFFSRQNHGLDSSDLRNFLNYNKVTNYPPRLTAFDLFVGSVKPPQDCLVISAVSLTDESQDVDLGILVDYQVTGVASPKARERIVDKLPLHVATFSGFFPPVVSRLQKLLTEHDQKAQLVSGRTILTGTETGSDDIIL